MNTGLFFFYFAAIVFAVFPVLEIVRLRKSFPQPFVYRYLQFLVLIFSLAIVWLFLWKKNFPSSTDKNFCMVLGFYYIAAFLLIFISRASLFPLIGNKIFKHLFSVFYNIPAVLYLDYHLRKFKKPLSSKGKENQLEEIFERYGISRREQDIVRGILNWQSNREISRSLFISAKTVETHIYNIYQKL